jgi:hypothetical protein
MTPDEQELRKSNSEERIRSSKFAIRNSAEDAPYWIRLLSRQRDLYRSLQMLAGRQRHLIAGDRPEGLLEILQQRHRLIRALSQLNMRLAPIREDWPAAIQGWPDPAKRLAGDLLSETREIMQAVMTTDEQDGRLLAARQQAVAEQVRAIPDARAANRAYAQQSQSPENSRRPEASA